MFKTLMNVKTLGAAVIAMVAASSAMAELPELPNDKWGYGPTTTTTDTATQVESKDFNRAAVASGGRASDRNKSNFRETTETTTTTTTETTPAINPGGKVDQSKSVTDTNTETSSTVTVDKIH
jgi:hypothetical protein